MSRLRGPHDVDRDLPELLQEVRVAQTGGQLFFAFLFSVAFAPGFAQLSGGQRALYGWDLFTVATAITVLVAPVAVHRWNFGYGMRPQLLVVTHVLSVIGLSILAVGLVLGLTLIGSIVFPGSPPWLAGSSAVVILVFWIVVPWLTRRAGGR
jgi:hypothetical protein